MLCTDCEFVKMRRVGYVSFRHYCGKKKSLGLHPVLMTSKPHPKCPLKNKPIKRGNEQMTNQPNQTRIVTGEVRFSFVNLMRPRESQYGGEPKYSVTILVPKSDTATKQRIDAAIEAAKQVGKSKTWNGVIPPVVAIPVYDGDGVKPSDGMPFGEECKGHWVFSASTKVDQPPKIVDLGANPIIDPTEVYSGMYGRIAINFAPYANSGKKGIGAYISTNVQKTRDGEPLGASAPAAADDFGAPAQQYQQAPQQQYQQAPQQQYPNGGLPTGMQGPSNQQQAQQFDPITGQPINGGVYGI